MGRPSNRPTPNTYRWIGEDGEASSFVIGDADDTVSFYGAAPVAQAAGATQVAPVAYVTGAFGLNSDVNMEALYDLVVAMRLALVDAGIMKGGA